MVDEKKIAFKGKVFGVRHVQCGFLFLGLAIAYSQRVNMSVGIVAMTDTSADPENGVYSWDEKTKAMVLSSFFWGYVLTQVPAGLIAQKFGAHKIMFSGILVSSMLATFTPFCARIGGWKLVCALRLIQGLCQGSVVPSTHSFISKWAPISERGLMGVIIYSGCQFGTSLMFSMSGVISASFIGWPGLFYISGAIGFIWALLFYPFASSSPSESRFISDEEKKFIEMLPVNTVETATDLTEEQKRGLPTPWFQIWTSIPFYCLLAAQCTDAWTQAILLTQIPTYLKSILGMDIKKNAVFSSLPYWCMFVLGYFFLFVSEFLRRTQCMSVPVIRRVFNTIGTWIPMLGLIAMGYLGKESEIIAVLCLMLTVGLKSAIYLGLQVNHIDLSPNFAGILIAITNCISQLTSVFAPLTVGFVVTDEKNPDQWKIIFFLSAGLLFLGNLLFICFGKFETQHWNDARPIFVKSSRRPSQDSLYKDRID